MLAFIAADEVVLKVAKGEGLGGALRLFLAEPLRNPGHPRGPKKSRWLHVHVQRNVGNFSFGNAREDERSFRADELFRGGVLCSS